MKVLYENNKIKIRHYSEFKCLSIDYFGVFNLALVEEGYLSTSKLNLSYDYIIGDLSKLTGSFNKLMEFYSNLYIQLKQRGVKGQALIVSDDLIINHLTDKLTKVIENAGIDVFVTTSREEAFNWVQNHN